MPHEKHIEFFQVYENATLFSPRGARLYKSDLNSSLEMLQILFLTNIW